MNCSDVRNVLPEMIEDGQNAEFQKHLDSCVACSELVSDLNLIASESRGLAASDDPAPRVWVKIAAELRAEGIIREPEAEFARPVPVSSPRRWSAWWLVPVAAALVAVVSYFSYNRPADQVAKQNPPAAVSAPEFSAAKETPVQPKQAGAKSARVAADRTAQGVVQSPAPPDAPIETVSTDDGQFLKGIGQQSPAMRATFESELKAVNAYIKDAEAYLQRNPDDEDARQQLMDAYEQKAMLYQMALDHVQ